MEQPEHPLDSILNQYKIPLVIGLIGLVLLIGGIISSGIIPKTFTNTSSPVSTKQTSAGSTSATTVHTAAKADVSGAVVSPGVYTLPFDARVEDAIKAAGGVTSSADPVYLSKSINLAQKVTDGMKIYVPKVGDAGQGGAGAVAGASTSEQKQININDATLAELDTLPGVGLVTAQKIIDNRPYSGIEELSTKKVVNKSVYDKIKGMVVTY